MAKVKGVKESKNFQDRISSLVPQLFSPPGQYKPNKFLPTEVENGYYNMLRLEMVKRMREAEAARKIQPAVQRYEDFKQPGLSPDIEPFWDEAMKKKFRDVMNEYHAKEKKRK